MAVTINAKDANEDGNGLDFTAYLANFDTTFTPMNDGSFNSADPLATTGTQYSIQNISNYGIVLTSGTTPFEYDFVTHTVSGSLDAVEFGSAFRFNPTTSRFNLKSDVKIIGLNVSDTALGGQILSDLMGGKDTDGGATSNLVNVLSVNRIVFNGSAGSDVFVGYDMADKLYGGEGNDVLSGRAGNDTIYGGARYDRLYGNIGDDMIFGGDGNDYISGGTGNDDLRGEIGDDELRGDRGNDRLSGRDGNDKLYGGYDDDILYGGNGNDILHGDIGNDVLTGGAGRDTFYFQNGGGNDIATDFEAGSAVSDYIYMLSSEFSDFEELIAKATDTPDGVYFEAAGTSITLNNVTKAALHANDFVFS